MKTIKTSIAIATLASFLGGNLALADDAPPVTDPVTQERATTPPAPGLVPPPAVSPPANGATLCGPMGYTRVDADYAPGRPTRVTGGMLVALGLATAIPGAALVGWSTTHNPETDRPVRDLRQIQIASGIATGVGALSLLAGIPVLAKGVRDGRKAREHRLTFAPSVSPRIGGGMAALAVGY
jgi:hypothetical protein